MGFLEERKPMARDMNNSEAHTHNSHPARVCGPSFLFSTFWAPEKQW